MNKRLSPQLDAAQRGAWLRKRRGHDVETPLGELLRDCQLTTEEVLELACIDILVRFRPESAVDLSEYFNEFPALAKNSESVLDMIDAEICARREHRLPIDASPYVTRFPQLANRIARLIEIDLLETSLDDGADFSVDEFSLGEEVESARLRASAGRESPANDLTRYCSVELPTDIRITGLLALRNEVTCLRGTGADNVAVVIKVVSKRRLADEDVSVRIGDFLERLSKISHQALIAPDVIAENATHVAMVRPFVNGTLLTNRYLDSRLHTPPGHSGHLGPPAAASIGFSQLLKELADLSYAIAAVHAEGLAHGSLHPHNLFRDHEGTLRIVDAGFGFPDAAVQWDWRLPAAPELASDPRHADRRGQRCDVASLVRMVEHALRPYADAGDGPVDTPLRQLLRWCQRRPPANADRCEAIQLADDLLALSDGRALQLPPKRSSWLPRRLEQWFANGR